MRNPADTGPAEALDRHQRRRDAGHPTVSVLVGPGALAAREGRLWADRSGRALVVVADPRAGAMADAWAVGLASRLDLARAVIEKIAGRRGEDPTALGGRIARMGPVERGLFLDAEASRPESRGADAARRWLLDRAAAGKIWPSPAWRFAWARRSAETTAACPRFGPWSPSGV